MAGETVKPDHGLATPELVAAFILERFDLWRGYATKAYSLWKEVEAYKYATDTTTLPQGCNFEHTTHIPVTAQIHEDLTAIVDQVLFPHEDWFTFKPGNKDSAAYDRRNMIVSFLKNRHSLSGIMQELRKCIDDYITYGNCFFMVGFENGVKLEEDKQTIGYVGPCGKRISPYDIVFDPTATTFKEAPKIIRETITIGELKRRMDDPRLDWDKEVIQRILDERSLGMQGVFREDDKEQQYAPAGFASREAYLVSGTVQLLWFYGDMYDPVTQELKENLEIVSIDGEWILSERKIDTWDGKPMIFHASWKRRPDNLWGMGPLDNIIGMNYQINHRENAKSDALDRMIVPDRVYQGDVEEVYDEELKRTIYLAPENGGVSDLGIDTQFFSFDLQIDRLTATSRQAARLPQELVGFRTPGEKTFGEVSTLVDGGMRGFIHKIQDFEINILQPMLAAELEISQKNIDESLVIAGTTEQGFTPFLTVSPTALKVQGVLIPQGAGRFARKNQILSSLSQLSSTPLQQIAAPHTSGKGVARMLEELTETSGLDIFVPNIAIEEQLEQQEIFNAGQQNIAASAAEPTIEEAAIAAEDVNGPV